MTEGLQLIKYKIRVYTYLFDLFQMMKEWAAARQRVQDMNDVDPKGAEKLNREITAVSIQLTEAVFLYCCTDWLRLPNLPGPFEYHWLGNLCTLDSS